MRQTTAKLQAILATATGAWAAALAIAAVLIAT
jgi:hypothetical protein